MSAKQKNKNDYIILDSEIVSISKLKKEAAAANRKFWALLVSFVLVASMIVPYLSLAANGVAASDSVVFTGTVIPGYSMGGIEIAAYGIDLNSWGALDDNETAFTKSTYGIWSGQRAENAEKAMSKMTSDTLESGDKANFWREITNRSNYTSDNPNGSSSIANSSLEDAVLPYRTSIDYKEWGGKVPTSADSASADITVSLYPDFVILSKNQDGKVSILQNPDDVYATGSTTTVTDTAAVPIYVPLSVLFDSYGLTESTATFDDLLKKIAADESKLNSIVNDDENNLLKGTHYESYDGSKSSDAFNPYPYTMVFQESTSKGTVTSSIYNNSEAYVYFSPASAYTQYVQLRKEYNQIVSNASDLISGNDTIKAVQLGYYAAALAILEAYLSESLPQDMTRGYVGPSEPSSVYENTPGDASKSFSDIFGVDCSNASSSNLKSISYATLYYSVAKSMDTNSAVYTNAIVRQTSAIMDTLSVFGYNTDGTKTLGAMSGMTRDETFSRSTEFTYYEQGSSNVDQELAEGVYVPVYYPVQQANMPSSEKTYRFQILSSIPYETVIEEIGQNGLYEETNLSYSKSSLDNLDATSVTGYKKKVSALAAQINEAEEETGGSLSEFDQEKSIVCNPDQQYTADESSVQYRVDNALLAYSSSSMNADNVHDLCDVVRSVNGLRLESWYRYYNPLKSAGGDNDLFISRISPAQTTYTPSILFKGYTAAGGTEISNTSSSGEVLSTSMSTTNISFDYYSIPSWSPCFASHTASDCYYGALTYELRPFFKQAFIETLSSAANPPLVEAAISAKEAVEELAEASSIEEQDMEQNMLGIYILAKRLAYANTMKAFDGKNQVQISAQELAAVAERAGETGLASNLKNVNGTLTLDTSDLVTTRSASLFSAFGADTPLISKKAGGDDIDDGSGSFWCKTSNALSPAYVVLNSGYSFSQVEKDYIAAVAKRESIPDSHQWDEISGETTFASYYGIADSGTSVEDIKNAFFQKFINTGYVDNDGKYGTGVKYGSAGTISSDIIFSYQYEKEFNKLLGQDGEYFWATSTEIRSFYPNVEAHSGADPATRDYQSDWNVSMKFGIAPDTSKSLEEAREEWEEELDELCSEVFKSIENTNSDLALLQASMPSQMQNCMAWADYQNSSDSEAQYQTDPSDANVTINISDSGESESEGTTTIHSLSDAQANGYDFKNGHTLASTSSADTSITSRMVRGVEGSTWTSTITPACYTMSATIGRIDALAAISGTAYPYYGIANGRLMSGTDQYALMQAHVIDYTSISSGISGDLATRTRAQTVSLTNPAYSGLPNFLDVLNIAGAFVTETATGMLKTTGGGFESSITTDAAQTDDGDTLSVEQVAKAVGLSSSLPATAAACSIDNVNMGRTPAAVASFNTSSGNLEYSATASADPLGIEQKSSSYLLTDFSGLYSVLQAFGLIIVMISLLIIAFSNFYAYTSGNAKGMLNAKTQLKVVFPRAIAAVLMIGLPPLTSGGQGFQGFAFILLQFLAGIMDQITALFMPNGASGIVTAWIDMGSNIISSGGIGTLIVFALCSIIMAIMFIIGTVCLFIQSLMLLVFYLTGPIVWGFYVWPYSGGDRGETSAAKGIVNKLTEKLKLGPWTNGECGNAAPQGWIIGYITTALLSVLWAVIFWLLTVIFTSAGTTASTAASATATSALLTTGYSDASSAIASAASLLPFNAFGESQWLQILFATALSVVAFIFMIKTISWLFKDVSTSAFGVANRLSDSIRGGIRSGVQTASDKGGKFVEDKMGSSNSETLQKLAKKSEKLRTQTLPSAAEKTKGAAKGLAKGVSSTLGWDGSDGLDLLGAYDEANAARLGRQRAGVESDLKEAQTLDANIKKLRAAQQNGTFESEYMKLNAAERNALEKAGAIERGTDNVPRLAAVDELNDIAQKNQDNIDQYKDKLARVDKRIASEQKALESDAAFGKVLGQTDAKKAGTAFASNVAKAEQDASKKLAQKKSASLSDYRGNMPALDAANVVSNEEALQEHLEPISEQMAETATEVANRLEFDPTDKKRCLASADIDKPLRDKVNHAISGCRTYGDAIEAVEDMKKSVTVEEAQKLSAIQESMAVSRTDAFSQNDLAIASVARPALQTLVTQVQHDYAIPENGMVARAAVDAACSMVADGNEAVLRMLPAIADASESRMVICEQHGVDLSTFDFKEAHRLYSDTSQADLSAQEAKQVMAYSALCAHSLNLNGERFDRTSPVKMIGNDDMHAAELEAAANRDGAYTKEEVKAAKLLAVENRIAEQVRNMDTNTLGLDADFASRHPQVASLITGASLGSLKDKFMQYDVAHGLTQEDIEGIDEVVAAIEANKKRLRSEQIAVINAGLSESQRKITDDDFSESALKAATDSIVSAHLRETNRQIESDNIALTNALSQTLSLEGISDYACSIIVEQTANTANSSEMATKMQSVAQSLKASGEQKKAECTALRQVMDDATDDAAKSQAKAQWEKSMAELKDIAVKYESANHVIGTIAQHKSAIDDACSAYKKGKKEPSTKDAIEKMWNL